MEKLSIHDAIPAAVGIVSIITYAGLVYTGTVEFQSGVLELLFAGTLVALGYDTLTDVLIDSAEDEAVDLVEELEDQE